MRYKCPYCEATYGALFILKTHVRERHAKSCPVCGWNGHNLIPHLTHHKDLPHLVFAFLVMKKRATDRSMKDKDRVIAEICTQQQEAS